MEDGSTHTLSRRERQIMHVLYRRGRATVAEALEGLRDPPSYSAVRTLIRILEEKGYVRHREDRDRYVCEPCISREQARGTALRGLMEDFFEGSREKLLAALLDRKAGQLDQEEYERLAELIDRERRKGR